MAHNTSVQSTRSLESFSVCVYYFTGSLRQQQNNKYKYSTYHIAIVTPRSKLHEASLLVKRKVLHVNLAERLVDGGWLPNYFSVVVEDCFRHDRHFIVTVGAGNKVMTLE